MPELPEVETLCQQLREIVSGNKILEFKILDSKLGRLDDLTGRTLLTPYRTGKELNLPLADGQVLRLHLRMTGRLLWQKDEPAELPHIRLVIVLSHGRLVLIDPRRFATLALRDLAPPAPAAIDPLVNSTASLWRERARSKRVPIKSFLLDQRVVSGIGNIYACEILHRAAISPQRATSDLSPAEWGRIGKTAKSILTKAIACRGTSISDWRDLFGEMGEYQHHLRVYGREGEPCLRCSGTVNRIKLGGRGTFFCPTCQK